MLSQLIVGFCLIKNMEKLKKCCECQKLKNANDFFCNNGHKDGLNSRCKKCHLQYKREHRQKNKKNILKTEKKYRDTHKSECSLNSKKYYYLTRTRQLKRTKNWRENNSDKIKTYKQTNRKRINEVRRSWKNKKRKEDICFRIRENVSSLIRTRLKYRLINKNRKKTFDFLPYTIDALKRHLENKFEPWMNWDNWGNKSGYWNIDHIIPDSLFKYKTINDVKLQQCWALENLQPLEFMANIKKSNKIII